MKRSRAKIIFRILLPIPFIIGVIGFLEAGYSLSNSLYGSFCYYFVSVYYSVANNWFMEVARWTAPLMTVTGVMYSVRGLFKIVDNRRMALKSDAVVIYYDNDRQMAELVSKNIPKSFIEQITLERKGTIYPHVKNQILLFEDDNTNLDFYYEHLDILEYKNVYIKLVEMDAELLAPSKAHYFNTIEMISTMYWKTHILLDKDQPEKRTYHIAIVGDTTLADRILVHGLHDNLYFMDQNFVYHLYSKSDIFKCVHSDLKLFNNDEIVYEEKDWLHSLDELSKMDRIILADRDNALALEKLMYKCPEVDIHYFCDQESDPRRFFRSTKVQPFGRMSKVLTKSNIMDNKLEKRAMELHYLYIDPEGSKDERIRTRNMRHEWLKLDGFMHTSYKAIAAFYYNYSYLFFKGYPVVSNEQDILKLEHIRWCRFYQFSCWKYGVPENGAIRDESKLIHRAIVPYEELNDEDRDRILHRIKFLIDAHTKDGK